MACRCQQLSMFAKRNQTRELAKKMANELNENHVLYIVEGKYFLFTNMNYAIENGIEYVEVVEPDAQNEVSVIEKMQDNDVL
jgi:hypothetical protein